MSQVRLLALVPVLAVVAACTSPPGASRRRQAHRRPQDAPTSTLAQLYDANPHLRERVEGAAGYAVFTNLNIHLLAVSGGDGYGVAVDRRTGKETFMRVAEIGSGPGIAMRDFRTVFVFRDDDALERFLAAGWKFSLESAAAAKSTRPRRSRRAASRRSRAAASEHATVQTEATKAATAAAGQGLEVYQLTQAGLALHAAALGTRYFHDSELN